MKNKRNDFASNGLPSPRDSLRVETIGGRGSPPFETAQRSQQSPQSDQPSQPTFQPTDESIQFLTLSEEQFRAFLSTLASSAGCKAELAPKLGVSAQFLGDVCAGRKNAGKKLLGALGADAITTYRVPISQEDSQ